MKEKYAKNSDQIVKQIFRGVIVQIDNIVRNLLDDTMIKIGTHFFRTIREGALEVEEIRFAITCVYDRLMRNQTRIA